MNYRIEEKLKEIPIACVREKALEYWGNSSERDKMDAEYLFKKSDESLCSALSDFGIIDIFDNLSDVEVDFWNHYNRFLDKENFINYNMPIEDHFTMWRFQCETIFKSATPDEQLLKLQEEIEEIKQELDTENVDKAKLGTEIADGIIVLLSLAQSAGISTEDILFSYLPNKIFKNVNRNWVKLPDGTFKHVKE